MSIAEKLTTIAENVPKVYEAGRQSMIDGAKVIRTTEQGSFVVIDDIADVKQDISVQLTSDTITDFSGVPLKVYKDNLFTDDFINGTFDNITGALMPTNVRIRSMNYIEVGVGTYTLYTPNTNHRLVVYMYDTNGNYLEAGSIKSWSDSNKMEFTVDQFCKILFAICVHTGAPISPNDVDWVLLTRSENAEPQVFTPNENGVVEGIDYSSTSAIFTTDNADVTINVTYYKSYWQLDESEYKGGYSVGFEDGKTAEHNKIWDGLQNSVAEGRWWLNYFSCGNRFIVDNGTEQEWLFYPTCDLKPNMAESMFRELNHKYPEGTIKYKGFYVDLAQRLEDLGVTLDFSICASITSAFYCCWLFTRLPLLDLSKCTNTTYAFHYNSISTIDGIKSSETTAWSNDTFGNECPLKHCPFTEDSVIAKPFNLNRNRIDLDLESLLSILNCLKDYSGTTTKYTMILGTKHIAKLEETEEGIQAIAVATQKGWTLA